MSFCVLLLLLIIFVLYITIMDDFDYNADPIIVIPVGTMLYTAGKLEDNSTCFIPFYYVKQHGHMNNHFPLQCP